MIRSRDIDNRRFVFTRKQSVALILHYFIGYNFLYPLILLIINNFLVGKNQALHPRLNTLFIIFMIISTVAIVHDPIRRSFNKFKMQFASHAQAILKNFGLLFLVNIAINIIIINIFKINSTPENQNIIVAMVKSNPVPMFLSTVIFAPIVEEIIFRGVFYQNLRSKTQFIVPILVSVLFFGGMHLVAGFAAGNGSKEMVFLLQYSSVAFFMIRSLESCDNIFGAIGVHFLNNLLGFFTIFMAAMIIF